MYACVDVNAKYGTNALFKGPIYMQRQIGLTCKTFISASSYTSQQRSAFCDNSKRLIFLYIWGKGTAIFITLMYGKISQLNFGLDTIYLLSPCLIPCTDSIPLHAIHNQFRS